MANLEGIKDKFIVIKKEDIEKYFTRLGKENFENMLKHLHFNRKRDGKNTDNKYLVINTDESYADEVIDILKKNGHWG